jgi:archaellum component FlaC
MDNELKEALSALLKAEFLPMFDRLDVIDKRLDGIDNRLGGIDNHLIVIDKRLDGLDNHLIVIDNRLDGLDNHLIVIDNRLDGIDNHLIVIDNRLDGLDTRLDRIEIDQIQIKQAVLETNATVKRIELIQEQQHSIIELLSARSIEHEAKIKRIL